jgi:hypothetical protein
MEKTVKILKASENGKIGGKAKVLKRPQGSWTTKKIFKIKNRKKMCSKHKQEPSSTC